MSGPGSARSHLSIGEVLSRLRGEFPDVTISKIRFLEAEGLITPDRTPAGYRKFSRADVARLQFVLSAQRDRYLPLKVIKDHLDVLDRGGQPPDLPGGPVRVPRALVAADGPGATDLVDGAPTGAAAVRLTRAEMLATAGLTEDQLAALEQFGLVATRSAHYDQVALAIAQTVAELGRFGIEPRHLRAFRTAADREIGLVEQVLAPLVRQRGPEARGRAEETARELAALFVRLHTALVKSGLRSALS